MHAGSMMGGISANPELTEIQRWFKGPDRANDCQNQILALKREANRYGRVVESHTVTERGDAIVLKAILRDAPKHRSGRKFRQRG